MDRDEDTSKFALQLAVDWASGAGVQAGQSKAGDAVEAAEQFERFLMRKQLPGGGRSLVDLLEEPAWFDQDWRLGYHGAVTEIIVGKLEFMTRAAVIGRRDQAVIDERWVAKGVRGLEVHHLNFVDNEGPEFVDHLRVDSAVIESSVFEVPIAVPVQHHFTESEDKMIANLVHGTETLINETAAALEAQGQAMINVLLKAAGWQPPEDYPAGAFAVPPFRVEFVQRDGWKAKEWCDEGGEYWHYRIRGFFGGVAFTIPR